MTSSLLPNLPGAPEGAGRDGARLRMASLAPQFDEQHHGLYRDLLHRAIDHPNTRNLALTGAYGAGKSSVLREIARIYGDRVIEISLSTLSPVGEESANSEENPIARTPTNRVQKEIVKQLLYRLPPRRTPRSRFPRASATSFTRELGTAAAWGGGIFAAALVLGAVPLLVDALPVDSWRVPVSYALLAVISIGAAWVIRHAIHGRLVVQSVSAGPATVTLAPSSTSYFDQYLDEIVYFFEVSKCDVVVIEDIDRFEDAYIFDTLRALNGLLNRSRQIGRRIVFVYAIRDSVFETIGSGPEPANSTAKTTEADHAPSPRPAPVDRAKAALERANRSKFFDVIVPVVPFITHDNARDLMSRAMASPDFTISPALIRLAARHVADMRLIHNIRNEFEVYRNRLIVASTPVFGLTDDLLFAVVLFKNAHLADFECIRLQSSTLDSLFALWRRLVQTNLATETKKLATLRTRQANARTAKARAAELGNKLLAHGDVLARAHRTPYNRKSNIAILRDGSSADDTVMTPEFWASVANGSQVTFHVHYQNYVTHLDFNAEDLESILRVDLGPTAWAAFDDAETSAAIDDTLRHLDFLRHHTWQELYHRPEFTVTRTDPSGADVSEAVSFAEHVHDILESQLARDLVEHGYLTHHFALYVSTFYGEHVSPDAMEYLMRCVERGEADSTYPLSDTDAGQVLTARGTDLLTDTSVYNVSLLDHLLTSRPTDAVIVARRLARWGTQEQQFVSLYVAQSEHAGPLIAAMAPHWPAVFTYVASDAPVEADRQADLLDAALSSCTTATRYDLDDSVRNLVEARHRELAAITRPHDEARAAAAFAVVQRSGAILASVDALDHTALAAAIDTDTYAVTEPNLAAISPTGTIELNVLRETRPRVYARALRHLAAYVDALGRNEATTASVTDPEAFAAILSDAAAVGPSAALDAVITSAVRECTIPHLEAVPTAAWAALVNDRRTACDFANIHAYLDQFEQVDEHLAALLSSAGTIFWTPGDAATDRSAVALQLINARDTLPDPAVRTDLAASLEPGALPAAEVTPESGVLASLLLRNGLLADEKATFSGGLMVDWATLEAAITASRSFVEFASPTTVPTAWIPDLLASSLVSSDVRLAVVRRLPEYLTDVPRNTVEALAGALDKHQWRLSFANVEALRAAGAPRRTLISLIARSRDNISDEQLRDLLRRMGTAYAQIADRGTSRPTIPDDAPHRAVLERLIGLNVVSSFAPSKTQRGAVRVQLRRNGR